MSRTKLMLQRPYSILLGASILVALLLMACPAAAQEAGTILGLVRDASGGTVPDARITITNVDTTETHTAATGDNVVFTGTTSLSTLAGGIIEAPANASASNPFGNVGQITTRSTTSRQIQLALKLIS
jgi:hypothetical protein